MRIEVERGLPHLDKGVGPRARISFAPAGSLQTFGPSPVGRPSPTLRAPPRAEATRPAGQRPVFIRHRRRSAGCNRWPPPCQVPRYRAELSCRLAKAVAGDPLAVRCAGVRGAGSDDATGDDGEGASRCGQSRALQRLGAATLAISTACYARKSRFAVVQDAQRDDSSLARSRNPGNVG
jgi:hypothetical protein